MNIIRIVNFFINIVQTFIIKWNYVDKILNIVKNSLEVLNKI